VYAFLQIFLATYKKFAESKFVITGESYAGHYIPAIAHQIQENNNGLKSSNPKELLHINLVSVAIGNGLTDPKIQYAYYGTLSLL
jgi:cathepsin A (carboxypeptidase C)